jgi:hypothetical protein
MCFEAEQCTYSFKYKNVIENKDKGQTIAAYILYKLNVVLNYFFRVWYTLAFIGLNPDFVDLLVANDLLYVTAN